MDNFFYKRVALFLLGGKGERYGSKIPKQFTYIGDDLLMNYGLKVLNECLEIDAIYIVCHPLYNEIVLSIVKRNNLLKVKGLFSSGESREESVYNGIIGLEELGFNREDIIAICDGDRPNLDKKLVKELIDLSLENGGAITARKATDSVFESKDGIKVSKYLDRREIYLAETPQIFKLSLLSNAFKKAKRDRMLSSFTDDASIVKRYIKKVNIQIAHSNIDNVKINTKEDGENFLRIWKK